MHKYYWKAWNIYKYIHVNIKKFKKVKLCINNFYNKYDIINKIELKKIKLNKILILFLFFKLIKFKMIF